MERSEIRGRLGDHVRIPLDREFVEVGPVGNELTGWKGAHLFECQHLDLVGSHGAGTHEHAVTDGTALQGEFDLGAARQLLE